MKHIGIKDFQILKRKVYRKSMLTNIKDDYLFSRDIFEWDLYLIFQHLAEKIKN